MRKIFFFIIIATLAVIQLVYAFDVSTSSYDVKSYHQGSAGNNGSTSSYTFRFTETFQQGSNPKVTTLNYNANSGWFELPLGYEPPIIFNVSLITNIFLLAGPSSTAVISSAETGTHGVDPPFLMEVSDANGIANLDDTTAVITLSRIGEPDIVSTSCIRVQASDGPSGGFVNYTCAIDLPWYAEPGIWTVEADVEDFTPNPGVDTYELKIPVINEFPMPTHFGFTINPSALTFATLDPGSTDQTPTNDPIIISNVGNLDSTDLIITAEDLIGDDLLQQINAGDFTVGLTEGVECDSLNAATEAMIDATPVSLLIAGATVPRGDYVTFPLLYLEELNVCLTIVDPTLIAQFYRTSNTGTTAWDTTTLF